MDIQHLPEFGKVDVRLDSQQERWFFRSASPALSRERLKTFSPFRDLRPDLRPERHSYPQTIRVSEAQLGFVLGVLVTKHRYNVGRDQQRQLEYYCDTAIVPLVDPSEIHMIDTITKYFAGVFDESVNVVPITS